MSNDGGPAFPFYDVLRNKAGLVVTQTDYSGMSLRDWFAAQALVGLAISVPDDKTADIVKAAYNVADAMLAEREKE